MRQMIGLNDVILLFVQLVGYDNLVGILLGINGVLLEPDIDFAEAHRCRTGVQAFPECQITAASVGDATPL